MDGSNSVGAVSGRKVPVSLASGQRPDRRDTGRCYTRQVGRTREDADREGREIVVDPQVQPIAGMQVAELNTIVADPSIFCGGGSVAAVSASGAAALALLVLELGARRRSNAEYREEMERSMERVRELQERLYQAADSDVTALNNLLAAQRAVRKSPDRTVYIEALAAAAETPLEIGRLCVELLEIIDAHMQQASRFTMSDFGAGAALAQGAVKAALLTTDVNVVLLEEEAGDAGDPRAEALAQEAKEVLATTDKLAERIIQMSHDVISESGEATKR